MKTHAGPGVPCFSVVSGMQAGPHRWLAGWLEPLPGRPAVGSGGRAPGRSLEEHPDVEGRRTAEQTAHVLLLGMLPAVLSLLVSCRARRERTGTLLGILTMTLLKKLHFAQTRSFGKEIPPYRVYRNGY